ncbi:efflux RND transporter periplasmic adaptor subunit [Emcibacter nanhaiensis]|uniref:HlyD family efflux transporter periplasmic adaptor subunit n=1 Tax=Emcibacter nanhaiensis TaxID=1505037 RepID=A0A501PGT2_9PROT|nr:HlyD family efflux transporter periplasmic adaptor subunit [Emcibacter nanhaiensis]TPD59076.1 HlyD family efflux transporter periplasmic adaptor subunit [Emcibacter nanhaiensis]
MSLKNIKTIAKYALGLLFLALLVYAFIPEAEEVDLETVRRGDVEIVLEAEGKTRIRDIYTVSAPIDGRMMRIESEPGDMVRAGETVIANMTPADPTFLDKRSETQARADVQGAEAVKWQASTQVDRARAELNFAEAEYRRNEELFKNGNVSIARLEEAELQLKMRQAELRASEADLQVAESQLAAARARLVQPGQVEDAAEKDSHDHLCQVCVHAPVDGKVLRIMHKSEGVIAMGTALAEIGDPTNLEIVVDMLSRDAVKVRPGDRALIRRWGGVEEINARVRLVEPSGFTKISALGVEEQRVNVILDFVDPPEKWQSLGDAFRVEVGVIVDRAENVLTVPVSALFRDNEKWSVFVFADGRAELRPVKVGRKNDLQAEILDGVKEGERVIVHPGNAIADDVRVKERKL